MDWLDDLYGVLGIVLDVNDKEGDTGTSSMSRSNKLPLADRLRLWVWGPRGGVGGCCKELWCQFAGKVAPGVGGNPGEVCWSRIASE